MDARLQLRVQRYGWDRAAAVYEEFWHQQLAPAQERLLALAAIRPGERVLDIACGTGLVTFPAAAATGPNGYVLATDISEEMVKSLASRAAAQGLAHVATQRLAAEETAPSAAPFDVVLCALGLMYVTDPMAVARAMRAALRPGGRCVVAVWGERKRCGWAEIFPITERRVASEVCPMFFGLGGGDALRMTMELAGFTDLHVERIATTLEYESADAACGAAFAGGPVALAYSRFDDATRESAHREYLESIAAWKYGDGYRVPGEFVVASGVAPNADNTATPAP